MWVQYAAGLAVAAFFFALGESSFLHGVLYAVVPLLWMAREAGRAVYLVDFGLVLLAAFGTDILFSKVTDPSCWRPLSRILAGVIVACLVALGVPALFGLPALSPWISLSVVFIGASYLLFRHVIGAPAGAGVRFLAVVLILSDLNAFEWMPRNKINLAASGTDHLERLLSARGAADFLKSRRGPFRTQVLADPTINIGDVFGLQTTSGGAVTLPIDYAQFLNQGRLATDLLNVRYFLRPAAAADPGPLYADKNWKVYENPQAYPRAWVVHDYAVEPSREKLRSRLSMLGTQPNRTAFLATALDVSLEPQAGEAQEEASVERYEANHIQLGVRARSRGLLVVSELFYPGWYASIDGKPARIYEVDGALRGVVVPAGASQVTFSYAPRSVIAGALLTSLAFLGAILAFLQRRRISESPSEPV